MGGYSIHTIQAVEEGKDPYIEKAIEVIKMGFN